ncbi:PA2779 family protein [Pseudomonas sp. Q1-7]|uniref:PA2779 family protein n=1 Tax=Pseudomonas sp. Q1-7 TaxID=3020843 RepID=UPI0023012119|nr:PA2779 family protein [Pseudomonas sp. Q1-7]
MKSLFLMFSTALMLACLSLLPLATAQADMIGTGEAIATQQPDSPDRARIDAFLSKSEVQEQLRAMGVDAAIARSRVQALTHEEAAQLAQKMDAVPAGGRISGTEFLLILLLIIVVAILL